MITAEEFGRTAGGETVTLYRLTNIYGAYIEVLSYGCILKKAYIPDGNGDFRSVCAGYDTLDRYETGTDKMGAVIGRCSGRIRNARFRLGGKVYRLPANDGANTLHGGPRGFDRRVWQSRVSGDRVVFSRLSPDGEEGFPGSLETEVSYSFNDKSEITIHFNARCDADTYCSMTSHAYWNLGAKLDNHLLQIMSDSYVEPGVDLLPTGRLLPMEGSLYDFRRMNPIGSVVMDHSFPLSGDGLRPALILRGATAHRSLTVLTDLPSIHVYTGNFLPVPRSSVAIEAQYIPDGMNSEVFPAPLLRAGEVWDHTIVYRFS